jgi:predicted methyltransferase
MVFSNVTTKKPQSVITPTIADSGHWVSIRGILICAFVFAIHNCISLFNMKVPERWLSRSFKIIMVCEMNDIVKTERMNVVINSYKCSRDRYVPPVLMVNNVTFNIRL